MDAFEIQEKLYEIAKIERGCVDSFENFQLSLKIFVSESTNLDDLQELEKLLTNFLEKLVDKTKKLVDFPPFFNEINEGKAYIIHKICVKVESLLKTIFLKQNELFINLNKQKLIYIKELVYD